MIVQKENNEHDVIGVILSNGTEFLARFVLREGMTWVFTEPQILEDAHSHVYFTPLCKLAKAGSLLRISSSHIILTYTPDDRYVNVYDAQFPAIDDDISK